MSKNVLEQAQKFEIKSIGKLKSFYFTKSPKSAKNGSNNRQMLPMKIIDIPDQKRFHVIPSPGLYFTR